MIVRVTSVATIMQSGLLTDMMVSAMMQVGLH
jgi:hypothetical protein